MKTARRVSIVGAVIFIGISLLSTSGPTAAFAASKEMIAAAIKEGGVSWLDAIVVPSSAKAIAEAFKKEYGLPDTFNVKHERIASGPIATRVAEEVKANRVTIDVFAAPVPTLYFDLKEYGALLRYDCPEYKNFSRATKVGLFNEPGYWQSAIAQVFAPVTNPKIFPKKIASWNDLLSPELAGGKITLPAIANGGGPLYCYVGWRKVLPKSYFEQMYKQKVAFDRGSSVDATQQLTQGQILVAITSAFRIVQTGEQTGVELVAHYPKEGVSLLGHPYGILAKSPHPNAAKLLVEFLFSEKGNRLFIDLEGVIAVRDGIKVPDKIRKYSPPLEEIVPIPMDWKSLDAKTLNQFLEEFKEIYK